MFSLASAFRVMDPTSKVLGHRPGFPSRLCKGGGGKGENIARVENAPPPDTKIFAWYLVI